MSRPHTPAPAPDDDPLLDIITLTVDDLKEHDAQVAKAAREQLLDLIRKTDDTGCPHISCNRGEGHDLLNCRDCLIKWVEESLRAQQEPQQGGGA